MADDLHFIGGDFYRICDRTGFKIRSRGTSEEWNGRIVRNRSWEKRNDQDFVRGVRDDQTVVDPRPRQPDVGVGPAGAVLTSPAAIGASLLNVSSTQGFTPGHRGGVVLDNGQVQYIMIEQVDPVGLTISTIDTQTSLLLHCDGANGSTSFIDSSQYGNVVTAHGNAKISSVHVEFGTGSASFDGTNSTLTVPDAPVFHITGDYTIDFWVYFNSLATIQELFSKRHPPAGYAPFDVIYNTTGGMNQLQFWSSSSGASWDIAAAVSFGQIVTNTFYHVAVCRSGNIFYMFLNGALVNQFTSSLPTMASTDQIAIGSNFNSSNFWTDGFMDEIRFSNGIARWTSSFAVPAQPYSTINKLNGTAAAGNAVWDYGS